jgi:hypothetical protein
MDRVVQWSIKTIIIALIAVWSSQPSKPCHMSLLSRNRIPMKINSESTLNA